MSTPVFFIENWDGEIKTLENVPGEKFIYVRSEVGLENDFENLGVVAELTNHYERNVSLGQKVFGRRLITEARIYCERREVEVLSDGQSYLCLVLKANPFSQKYGAAEFLIRVKDYNDPYDIQTSEPLTCRLKVQRVNDPAKFSKVPDITIPKNGYSKAIQFSVGDEERGVEDLDFYVEPENQTVISGDGILYGDPVEPIKNGFVRMGRSYRVVGGKEIKYSGFRYRDGSTFKGVKDFDSWQTSGETTGQEKIYEVDGPVRSFQILPKENVTGSSKMNLTVWDKMTIDFATESSPFPGEIYRTKFLLGYLWVMGEGFLAKAHPQLWDSPEDWDWEIFPMDCTITGIAGRVKRDGQWELVACGYRWDRTYCDNGVIYLSNDGVHWVDQLVPSFAGVTSITWGYGNGVTEDTFRYVAVGFRGYIYSSKNGIGWRREWILTDSMIPLPYEDTNFLLHTVEYIDGKFITAGDGERIYICNYKFFEGEPPTVYWSALNHDRVAAIANVGPNSPPECLFKITSIGKLPKGWILVGIPSVLTLEEGVYSYEPDRSRCRFLASENLGGWKLNSVEEGRGALLSLSSAEYLTAVGYNRTIVVFSDMFHYFVQWTKKSETSVLDDGFVMNSVTAANNLLFIARRNTNDLFQPSGMLVSCGPVQISTTSFYATVTDWWETKDFLPENLTQYPLFKKSMQLLDYLVANNHIDNMIKVDNLYNGKSVHFDDTYLTDLLCDDLFKDLSLAQENRESLAMIAANLYNMKGTRKGFQYLLRFLSVGGETLDAEVHEWKQVNLDPVSYGLDAPMEACSLLVNLKVPVRIYVDPRLEERIFKIAKSFFWICLEIEFGWIRTLRTSIEDFRDILDLTISMDPFMTSIGSFIEDLGILLTHADSDSFQMPSDFAMDMAIGIEARERITISNFLEMGIDCIRTNTISFFGALDVNLDSITVDGSFFTPVDIGGSDIDIGVDFLGNLGVTGSFVWEQENSFFDIVLVGDSTDTHLEGSFQDTVVTEEILNALIEEDKFTDTVPPFVDQVSSFDTQEDLESYAPEPLDVVDFGENEIDLDQYVSFQESDAIDIALEDASEFSMPRGFLVVYIEEPDVFRTDLYWGDFVFGGAGVGYRVLTST